MPKINLSINMHCLISQSKDKKEDCRNRVCIGFHNGFIVCKNLIISFNE